MLPNYISLFKLHSESDDDDDTNNNNKSLKYVADRSLF